MVKPSKITFWVVEPSKKIFIRVILGFYWDNGKDNGNYYNGVIGVLAYIGVIFLI